MTLPFPQNIDRFKILQRVASGGMGEIFLAYDPLCERQVALKRIKESLATNENLKKRFVKEAKIASRLTHPSIIPILETNFEANIPYYTMPFIEGKNLKEHLLEARKKPATYSGARYLQSFYLLCHAMHYVHSKKILHRDLKPENIIIGKFGEVMIIDWGLAEFLDRQDPQILSSNLSLESDSLTMHGRIVGTVSYLAPERIQGQTCTVQTDLYALGVILFQLLTLKMPFRRPTLKEFKKNIHQEELISPSEMAPYRDIPPLLEQIAIKCIKPNPKERYSSMKALLQDLEGFMQGRSEWMLLGVFDPKNKHHWQVEADVALAKHLAISRNFEGIEWVHIQLANKNVFGGYKLVSEFKLLTNSEGFGFLLSIPIEQERMKLEEGYCLWLSANPDEPSKLFRSSIEVLRLNHLRLNIGKTYQLTIEKQENTLHCFLNDEHKFTFTSYLPSHGSKIGLMSKDSEHEIKKLELYTGSMNVQVSCLAIPDAFLAHKDYDRAIFEYRKIASAFKGRKEARIAQFNSAVTLLEKAKAKADKVLCQKALEEFEKLQNTPGAPLEYLGKALVYQTLKEYEEEAKCFELAFRKYKKHPLLATIQEQLNYRLHRVSTFDRSLTYRLLLTIVKHAPDLMKLHETRSLIKIMQQQIDKWSLFEKGIESTDDLAIELSFLLKKPLFLLETLKNLDVIKNTITLENGLFALIELCEVDEAIYLIDNLPSSLKKTTRIKQLRILCNYKEKPLYILIENLFAKCTKFLGFKEIRAITFLLQKAIEKNDVKTVDLTAKFLETFQMTSKDRAKLDALFAKQHLFTGSLDKASKIFESYEIRVLQNDMSPLFPPYVGYLFATKGEDVAQDCLFQAEEFSFSLENKTPYEKQKIQAIELLFNHCKKYLIDPTQ